MSRSFSAKFINSPYFHPINCFWLIYDFCFHLFWQWCTYASCFTRIGRPCKNVRGITPDHCFKGRGWEKEGAPRKILVPQHKNLCPSTSEILAAGLIPAHLKKFVNHPFTCTTARIKDSQFRHNRAPDLLWFTCKLPDWPCNCRDNILKSPA